MVLLKSFYIHWSAGRSPRVHEVNLGWDPSLMIMSKVQQWVISMFGSILEVVDILMLRSPIFEVLYSPELDFRIFVWPVCSSLC